MKSWRRLCRQFPARNTTAGGQNALGALLFHPEFYKAAVSSAGCHDNRMDKIWWNEQWMGWPLGTEYSASSNVDNAYRLKDSLLLSVGEMDPNVDPASTMQVVNALIKANKTFDLIVLPGRAIRRAGSMANASASTFLSIICWALSRPPGTIWI